MSLDRGQTPIFAYDLFYVAAQSLLGAALAASAWQRQQSPTWMNSRNAKHRTNIAQNNQSI
jgi:hypothetical protein